MLTMLTKTVNVELRIKLSVSQPEESENLLIHSNQTLCDFSESYIIVMWQEKAHIDFKVYCCIQMMLQLRLASRLPKSNQLKARRKQTEMILLLTSMFACCLSSGFSSAFYKKN